MRPSPILVSLSRKPWSLPCKCFPLLLSSFHGSTQTTRKKRNFLFIALLLLLQAGAQSPAVPATQATFSIQPAIAAGDTSLLPASLSAKQKKGRQLLIGGLSSVGYGGALVVLNSAWYKDYPHTSFKVFNDSREWLQMDKVGHAWTAYNTGRATTAMWEWAGLPHKKAVLVGGLSGVAFLTGIEFLDAHSSKWGWSWSDIAANFTGAGLFVGQEYLWNEQRIQFKFSLYTNNYREPILEQRADNLFGKTWYERMLKDYNAQTYWFSANLHSFLPDSRLPAWLNISIGYGADGMFGGFGNRWLDPQGNSIDRNDIQRRRQFYLAPDIDFTRIKTKSRVLKTVFSLLNSFKCPAPAVMMKKGKFRFYTLYF